MSALEIVKVFSIKEASADAVKFEPPSRTEESINFADKYGFSKVPLAESSAFKTLLSFCRKRKRLKGNASTFVPAEK